MRLALLLACLPSLGLAQQPLACASPETMTKLLAETWGESRQSVALDGAGALVELFASPDTGTWSLVVTRPGGPACIMASGRAFELVAVPPGEPA